MKPDKIKVKIRGTEFELPSKCLRETDYRGNSIPPYISIDQVGVASICKQYVKKHFPSVACSVSSDSYSMGDSVNVYLSTPSGDNVSKEIISDVVSFCSPFQYGRFNGMEDIYENNESEFRTDNNTLIDGGTKYLFVNNGAKFGTVADVARMLKDYQRGHYNCGPVTLERAIAEILRYKIPQKVVDKALQLI
jgi:hypothetical protein